MFARSGRPPAHYSDSTGDASPDLFLDEKIPPRSEPVSMPPSLRASLVDDEVRTERGHPDIRVTRRAETISRLAAVARERGEVTDGLRRVFVVQAVRLAYIYAERLAFAEGRPGPAADAINMNELVGTVLVGKSDPLGETGVREPTRSGPSTPPQSG